MGRTWPSKVGNEEMELVSIMRGLFETGKARASHIRGGMVGCSLNNADWAQRCMLRDHRYSNRVTTPKLVY